MGQASVDSYKLCAQRLRAFLLRQGLGANLTHSHLLHAVAAAEGLPSWQALISSERPPCVLVAESCPSDRIVRLQAHLADRHQIHGLDAPQLAAALAGQPLVAAHDPGRNEWYWHIDPAEGMPRYHPLRYLALRMDTPWLDAHRGYLNLRRAHKDKPEIAVLDSAYFLARMFREGALHAPASWPARRVDASLANDPPLECAVLRLARTGRLIFDLTDHLGDLTSDGPMTWAEVPAGFTAYLHWGAQYGPPSPLARRNVEGVYVDISDNAMFLTFVPEMINYKKIIKANLLARLETDHSYTVLCDVGEPGAYVHAADWIHYRDDEKDDDAVAAAWRMLVPDLVLMATGAIRLAQRARDARPEYHPRPPKEAIWRLQSNDRQLASRTARELAEDGFFAVRRVSPPAGTSALESMLGMGDGFVRIADLGGKELVDIVTAHDRAARATYPEHQIGVGALLTALHEPRHLRKNWDHLMRAIYGWRDDWYVAGINDILSGALRLGRLAPGDVRKLRGEFFGRHDLSGVTVADGLLGVPRALFDEATRLGFSMPGIWNLMRHHRSMAPAVGGGDGKWDLARHYYDPGLACAMLSDAPYAALSGAKNDTDRYGLGLELGLLAGWLKCPVVASCDTQTVERAAREAREGFPLDQLRHLPYWTMAFEFANDIFHGAAVSVQPSDAGDVLAVLCWDDTWTPMQFMTPINVEATDKALDLCHQMGPHSECWKELERLVAALLGLMRMTLSKASFGGRIPDFSAAKREAFDSPPLQLVRMHSGA